MKMRTTTLSVILIGSLIPTFLAAQERSLLPSQLMERQQITTPQSVNMEQYPLDAPVDPDFYIVGGGDRIFVQIEVVPPLLFALTVGIDGSLVIPTVGQVSIGGMTLREATEEIRAAVQRIHRQSTASLNLSGARRVLVKTAGNALRPQSFEATASDRVSTIVGNPAVVRSELPALRKEEIRDTEPIGIARRSILLRRSNGTQQRVDLDMYAAMGDSKWNPHISEGDEIIANMIDEHAPSIAIGGAVWLPGEFEYITGDRLAELLRFGRGIRSFGMTDSVILARVGSAPTRIDLASEDTLIFLQPGDRVWVPFQRSMTQANMVTVAGEVAMPGKYPLLNGTTRLSDILQIAGGLTDRAMLHGATLHRMRSSMITRDEDLLLAQRGNMAVDDTTYVRQEGMLRLLGERVNVSFLRAIDAPGSVDDPLIQAGDRINIPLRTGTIYVFGQVAAPGHVPFEDGTSFDAYVRMAGGYTERAKTGEAVVIKYASRQWLDPSESTVEEGDAIWVPKEIKQTFAIEAMAYGQFASILSSVATLVLVISQLAK